MSIKNPRETIAFNGLGVTVLLFFTIICLLPFVLMVSGSFSSNGSIIKHGYSLWPQEFSTSSYEFLFRFPDDIVRSYGVTILITALGTTLGLFLISMAGYVLQRKDFKYRNTIAFFIYFTTIFQGGLIPWYILMVNVLNWRNTYQILIWTLVMNPFLIILMRSFINASVPHEMTESAKMDGAGDFTIYRMIILPMCGPALATIGLFLALNYWNDWFSCALFIDDRQMYPLQYFLYNALTAAQYINQLAASGAGDIAVKVPGETVKLAMALVSMGPILLVYPFIQRFFVKGITVGAIKG